MTKQTFKKGDRVWLSKDATLAAKAGATATVLGYHEGWADLLNIRWDRDNELHEGQMDGGYFPDNFELITKPAAKPMAEFKAGAHVFITSEEKQPWPSAEGKEGFVVEPDPETPLVWVQGMGPRYFMNENLTLVMSTTTKTVKSVPSVPVKPTAPADQAVLDVLLDKGNASAMELTGVTRVRNPARAIFALRNLGWKIITKLRYDTNGQRYARWYLESDLPQEG